MVEGHYRALLWDEKTEQWKPDSDLGILINVEVSELSDCQTVTMAKIVPTLSCIMATPTPAIPLLCRVDSFTNLDSADDRTWAQATP